MTKHQTRAIVAILLLAAGIQAFRQQNGVADFTYWQTGHPFETGSGGRSDSRFISFNNSFNRVPRISLALEKLDSSKDANLRIDLSVGQVTRNGFTINVNTWADTKIYAVGVAWIAYA